MTDQFETLEPGEPAVRRRRHPIRNTIIVLVIIAALGVSGYLVANSLAKSFALTAVKTGVAQETGADPTDIHVSLGTKPLLPQMLARTLDTVHVRIGEFSSGTLSGSAVFDGVRVPLSTSAPAKSMTIAVTIGHDALLSLVESTAGESQALASIGNGVVTISSKDKLLGHTVPFSVDFAVSASGDNLILTPQKIAVNGKAYTPSQLKSSPLAKSPIFGGLVSRAIATQTQCLAAGLPSAMHLTGVKVVGTGLVVTATGSHLSLQGLSSKGTCPAS
ncbi:MAG TPA: LmeA family phospholipid-binding protein [Galbitalea sp.]